MNITTKLAGAFGIALLTGLGSAQADHDTTASQPDTTNAADECVATFMRDVIKEHESFIMVPMKQITLGYDFDQVVSNCETSTNQKSEYFGQMKSYRYSVGGLSVELK